MNTVEENSDEMRLLVICARFHIKQMLGREFTPKENGYSRIALKHGKKIMVKNGQLWIER
jgi:hypothetical protein